MIKNTLFFAALLTFLLLAAGTLHAQYGALNTDQINKPVVIELFTSQSCSSCPPADENLRELSQNPNVIALGFHVTYWNHLNWKDTLSYEFATGRQRAYTGYKHNGRVYTPQMIINGDAEFVGSRRGDIATALKNAREITPINIAHNDATLNITLPQVENGAYRLWLAGVQKEYHQDIPSGENSGKSVTYSNAVHSWRDAGAWDGTGKTLELKITPSQNIDYYVILAQEKDYGPIIAAGKSL